MEGGSLAQRARSFSNCCKHPTGQTHVQQHHSKLSPAALWFTHELDMKTFIKFVWWLLSQIQYKITTPDVHFHASSSLLPCLHVCEGALSWALSICSHACNVNNNMLMLHMFTIGSVCSGFSGFCKSNQENQLTILISIKKISGDHWSHCVIIEQNLIFIQHSGPMHRLVAFTLSISDPINFWSG